MICFFCFYNISTGIQAKLAFDKDFKHSNIITFDGEIYLCMDFDSHGIHIRQITAPNSAALIRGLKYVDCLISIVAVEIEERMTLLWKPYMVRSCNEIDRYISGIDIGFTFNPKHLYNKLLRYNGSNYKILYHWRR